MNTKKHPKCQEPGCRCGAPDHDAVGFGRRDFLKLVGAGATAALAFHPWQFAMAGPFTRADFDKLVPARQEADAGMGEVAHRARPARGVSRGGPGEDRDAGGRHLRGATLPGRRRQALALGHLQHPDRHWGGALRQTVGAHFAAGAGIRAADRKRGQGPGTPAGSGATGATSPLPANTRSATSNTRTRPHRWMSAWKPFRHSSRSTRMIRRCPPQ